MIPSNKYVSITTSYKGNNSVSRSYHGRIFSQNTLIPSATVLAFYNLSDVQSYFGSTSLEAKQAGRYFGYTSPVGLSCGVLEFYKYSPSGSNAFILGTSLTNANLAALQSETNGQLTLTFNGVTDTLANLDFSTSLSFAQVATILNDAWGVVTKSAKGTNPEVRGTKGTVTYNENQKAFIFTVVTAGVSTIGEIGGTAGVILNLGLTNPTLSVGSAVQSITQCFTESTNVSDNFGSYTFSGLTLDVEIIEASSLAAVPNTANYLYSFESDTLTFTVLETIGSQNGTVANYDNKGQSTSICPMAIFGSTNYNAEKGVTGYMYRSFPGMEPVITDATYLTLDALKVNYYGQTSKNGVKFTFYQDGYCTGLSKYLEVYTGSIHSKQVIDTALFNLLLNTPLLPIGEEGESTVRGVITPICNSLISVGVIKNKTLTELEEKDIISSYGKEALTALQDNSFYIEVNYVGSKITYVLVYISVIGVRKIEGSHIIIAEGI